MLITFVVVLFAGQVLCNEENLQLSDERYYQLPALFEVQNYEKCLSQRENVYCAGVFELSSPEPSPVYDVLKKLSANKRHNFNHTLIRRAVCLGPKSKCPVKDNLTESFEECIGRSMFEEYGLQADIIHFDFCRRSNEKPEIDGVVIVFCVYLTIVVVLNVIGTVYDWVSKNSNANLKGHRWLMAFSLIDNWQRLTSTFEGKDSRFQNLSCFYGIKTLSMFIVHLAHVPMMIYASLPTNPKFVEEMMNRPMGIFLSYNGNIVIQSFVCIANFLTAYKMLILSEKHKMKFSLIPKLIIDRIIRIQPVHLTTIGIMATIFMHSSDGPLWYKHVGMMAERCRQMWWHHLFFLNNSEHWGDCMPQSWHLAMDFQVYLICSIIMLWILGRGLNPEYVLKRLLMASLLVLFAIAYTFELLPQLLYINPENILTLFAEETSHVYLYQSIWGNLPPALVGLLLASTYYRLEREKIDLTKNKTFVAMYHLSLLLLLLFSLMAFFFMNMESRLAVSLYATVEKFGFVAILSVTLVGCFYKIKGPATCILCWPGWRVLSRLSLSSLMTHVLVNGQITLSRIHNSVSYTQMLADTVAVSVFSYLLALPLALLIENPAVQLYKTIVESSSEETTEMHNSVKSKYS